jgi:hypothetical protein
MLRYDGDAASEQASPPRPMAPEDSTEGSTENQDRD